MIAKGGFTPAEIEKLRSALLQEVEEQVAWETELRLRNEFKFYAQQAKILQHSGKEPGKKNICGAQEFQQMVNTWIDMNNHDLATLRNT